MLRPSPRSLVLLALLAVALAASPRAAATPAAETRAGLRVAVYFPRGAGNDCSRVAPRARVVPRPAVLTRALESLVAGPTVAERRLGYGGWFSARTAGSVRSVRLSSGVAYVDLADFSSRIPGASSSCGSMLLLAQLDRTATQFPTVRRAIYSFDGSRRAFYEWLQRPTPRG